MDDEKKTRAGGSETTELAGIKVVKPKQNSDFETKSLTGANSSLILGKSGNAFEKIAMNNIVKTNYTLTFDDIFLKVDIPWWMPAFATPGVPGQTKEILKGINGYAASGQVIAIIGASGSGKTSLLDQLSQQPLMHGGYKSGEVRVNKREVTDTFFKAHCAYVHQDDRLWGALTVWENLELAGKLYQPNATQEERKARMEAVLEAMGLQSCAHTKVGNILIKGISGGQRRRTSVAVELMGNPSILFLDEPTSGLDSKSAAEIMAILNLMSKRMNLLIVTVIHQPSSRTFLNFDYTLLLSKGKVAYFGPAMEALGYFSKLGYESPKLMNPADYLIEITNPDFADATKVDNLIHKWDQQWEKMKESDKNSSAVESSASADRKYAASLTWQIWVLLQRMSKSYLRDPGAYIGRGVLYTAMSIIFGIIYIGATRDQDHVLDYLFAITWGMATPSYMAVMIMPIFTYESATFEKEAKNGMYSPLAYVLSTTLVQIPFMLVTSTLSVVPYYWIDDINPNASAFFQFWILQFVFLFVVESICAVAASLIPNFVIALGVVVSLLSNFFVFNGLFVTPDSVPWVLRWIQYISPHYYTQRGLSYIAFHGQTFSGYDNCQGVCYGANGDDVLDAIQGLSSNVNFGVIYGVLIGEIVVLRLWHWILLRSF